MDDEFFRVHDHLGEVYASVAKQLEGISPKLENIVYPEKGRALSTLSTLR